MCDCLPMCIYVAYTLTFDGSHDGFSGLGLGVCIGLFPHLGPAALLLALLIFESFRDFDIYSDALRGFFPPIFSYEICALFKIEANLW